MRPQAILRRAADVFGVTVADLTGPGRARHLVRARFAAAWAMRKLCPARSLAEIGAILGGRDHHTILNAIQRAETLARHDSHYRAQMWALLGEERAVAAQPVEAPTGEDWWRARAYWWPHTTPAA